MMNSEQGRAQKTEGLLRQAWDDARRVTGADGGCSAALQGGTCRAEARRYTSKASTLFGRRKWKLRLAWRPAMPHLR